MSNVSQSRHDDAAADPEPRRLPHRSELRCTSGRMRVLTLPLDSGRHVTPSKVCEELGSSGTSIHPTTAYRNLEGLTAVGLAHAVHGPGPTRYDISGEPHHHSVCRRCGHVDGLVIPHLTEAAERSGLLPDSSGSLLVYGICARCGG
ncbi:Fur family transcriptional regulator [Streptomyces sp. LaPpAH-108]|uniref:Fur family transcriptional regulator n=1 Tax=Streptomyces sp. LaPpAH-108 TaxID=1155714 RepID=UPI000372C53B|nr:transcriptional repressor [Streptomyces sp. LaPpAH-108]